MLRLKLNNKLLICLYLVLLFGIGDLVAQNNSKQQKQFDKARKYYEAGKFTEAIKEASAITDKWPDFSYAYFLLADIYLDLDSTHQEIKSLNKVAQLSNNPIVYKRLGKAHQVLQNYTEAILNYNNYLQKAKLSAGKKNEIQRAINNCEFAIYAIKNPVDFHPRALSTKINSMDDEYWPSLSVDQKQLVFTRLLKPEGQIPHEDFYVSDLVRNQWELAKPIEEINSLDNEGAQSLSVNGKFLLFTACNRENGFGSCDIYYSKKVDGKWSTPKNAGAPVNTRYWETQPSFSSDNRYLYFASNRSGGKGGKDIWRAEFQGIKDGKVQWGEPENLGDSINTPGNEISPFIHANNKSFYFASDYHTGMGGYDLFQSTLKPGGKFTTARNLGYPINTPEDEQGLNISADGTSAFFSSTRNENSGLDIFTFTLEEDMRPDPVTYAQINIVDAKTKKPVMATLELMNLTYTEEKRSEPAEENGEALLCFPLGANYAFNVKEPGYLIYSQSFKLSDERSVTRPYKIYIKLEPIEVGAKMDLYNIYFETDSFRILPQSVPELNNLVAFLMINKDLVIEIQGHTDSTGDQYNNQKLSERRAHSVVNYLNKNGIDLKRLKYKGFGQNKPVASNETAKGRQLNRRTTIKILQK